MITLFMILSRRAYMDSVASLSFSILLAAWCGCPLFVLDRLKVLYTSRVLYWLLLVAGISMSLLAVGLVFFSPSGSTEALALVFVPVCVIAVYLIVAGVLVALKP